MGMIVSEKYAPDLRAALMERETSIRAEVAAPNGGRIVTMGFPGLAFGVAGESYIDPARMAATLAHPSLDRCRLLVVLLEADELPEGAMAALKDACATRGMTARHLPVADYMSPSPAFEREWATIADSVDADLRDGRAVALTCHYGAGRSGMIAASLLIDRGLTSEAAVAAIRAQFPDSVESHAQRAWLDARAAGSPL